MQEHRTKRSIRWKLAFAFIAVAGFVAAFGGVSVRIHLQTVEQAAQLEAEHVAELIGAGALQKDAFRPDLMDYVGQLHSLRKRDVVIIGTNKRILADVVPEEVGTTFNHDIGNEVGQTIADGRPRVFIEESDAYPEGAYQVVVPLRASSAAATKGAVVLEYTWIRRDLIAAERGRLYAIVAIGIFVVLAVTVFGLKVARRITQPIEELKSSLERVGAHDYDVQVAVTSRDEMGVLSSAFNKMALQLAFNQAELAEHKRDLEQRVADRTARLSVANAALQRQVKERIEAQRELQLHRDQLQQLVDERTREALDARDAAEAANRAKSEFLTKMSHELRTPMHAILSYATLGVDKFATAELPRERTHQYFMRVQQSGKRLLVLLNDLLDLSKLEAGKMAYQFEQNDLRGTVQTAIAELEAVARDKDIALRCEVAESIPLTWYDNARLLQVFSNLLSNALKFSPVGSTVTIALQAATTKDGVPAIKASVSDQGIGIPQSELDAIFQNFTQSTRTHTAFGGTGLGLAICRQIVRDHGGDIWAQSSEGKGSCISFLLPLEVRSSTADPAHTASPQDVSAVSRPTARQNFSKRPHEAVA